MISEIMAHNPVFVLIGLIFIIATFFAYLTRALKQPLIPAYIITGLLIGPIFRMVSEAELIMTLSEIGIAFLLFIVGLEIEFKKLRSVLQVSTIGGLIKIFVLFMIGFIAAKLLGFDALTGVYLGVIIAFSSTMIVIKLLSDKSNLDTLHGRIVLGILLMEDLIAIIVLSMLSNSTFSIDTVIYSVLKIIFLIITLFFMNFFILPPIFKFAAETKQLLFLASISVLFFFSIFSMAMGISLVIGAFIAGIALANLPYNHEIIAKVMSLKDFFSTIFFVSIGMTITLESVRNVIIPFLIFLVIVILVKPLLMMVITTMFGYKKRPAFRSSIAMAQISEFSLIVSMTGLGMGHISNDINTLTIMVALVSMGVTSYFINYDMVFYRLLSKKLDIFEEMLPHKQFVYEYKQKRQKYDMILAGHNRVGYSILEKVKKMNKKIMVIDFNPEVINELVEKNVPCIYGDLGDTEILKKINFKDAKIVISTVPDKHDNLLLVHRIKKVGSKAIIFTTASNIDDALELYKSGTDYVILPHLLGGEHAAFLVENLSSDIQQVLDQKQKHIRELEIRKSIGHDYPVGR